MKIKLNTKDVKCIFPSISYDWVASRLRDYSFGVKVVFCSRQVGNGFLQWSLPEGNWTALSDVEASLSPLVYKVYNECLGSVSNALSCNKILAQAILTTPSEDYVFYRLLSGDNVELAFTAWGYRYPHKCDTGVISGPWNPPVELQEVALRFVYDSKPIDHLPFTINGQSRNTNKNGMFDVGSHPVGMSFPINIEEEKDIILTIEKGRKLYEFDLTKYVIIEVVTRKGGVAAPGISCVISFNGRTNTIVTDKDGRTQVKFPFRKEAPQCTALVDGMEKSRKTTIPKTTFCFDLPYSQNLVCIDSDNKIPIPGVRNLITIAHQNNIKESIVQISNSKGEFVISAQDDSIVEIVSTKTPDYETKKTPSISFNRIFKTILMKPEKGTLLFRTIDAKTGKILPDCDLNIVGSISGIITPSNSGNGEFRVSFRKTEKLSVTASKKWYKAMGTINNKTWAYLQSCQERRDLSLSICPIAYENRDHPKYEKKYYFLYESNRKFKFEWNLCSVCTMLTVTDANGKIICRCGINSPNGDGKGERFSPPSGSTILECPTETVCVIIQSVNQDKAYFKIYCD